MAQITLPQFSRGNVPASTPVDMTQFARARMSWMDRAQRREQEAQQFEILKPVMEAEANWKLATMHDELNSAVQMRQSAAQAHSMMPEARTAFENIFQTPEEERVGAVHNFIVQYSHLDRFQELSPTINPMVQMAMKEAAKIEEAQKARFGYEIDIKKAREMAKIKAESEAPKLSMLGMTLPQTPNDWVAAQKKLADKIRSIQSGAQKDGRELSPIEQDYMQRMIQEYNLHAPEPIDVGSLGIEGLNAAPAAPSAGNSDAYRNQLFEGY